MNKCPRCQYPLSENRTTTTAGTDVVVKCSNCGFFNMQHYGVGIKV